MSAEPPDPILHYDPCATGRVMAVEYHLDAVPPAIASRLDPWLSQFTGLDDSTARSILESSWQSIQEPYLLPLRDFLLRYSPTSILWDQVRGWLVISDGPPTEFRGAGDVWFLLPPAKEDVLQRQLEKYGLQTIDGLSTFLRHFNGLREQLPSCAGYLFTPQNWEHLDQLGWEEYIENCEDYEGWQHAVMFWHALNGDMVLLNPTGETAWWVMELNKVVPLAPDFASFVRHFVARIKRRCPFDSWPPSD
jgi:hypothetical protein